MGLLLWHLGGNPSFPHSPGFHREPTPHQQHLQPKALEQSGNLIPSLQSVQPTPRLSQGKHFTGCGRFPSVFPSYFSAEDTVFAGAIIPLIHWTHPDNPSLQNLGREQLEQGLSSKRSSKFPSWLHLKRRISTAALAFGIYCNASSDHPLEK